VDGTSLGLPVMGIHMHDVGFSLENRGVAPDLHVPIAPHDYAAGKDPQLEAAIAGAHRVLRRVPLEPQHGHKNAHHNPNHLPLVRCLCVSDTHCSGWVGVISG
jgi:C-terminal processing protease CtpA/Prc